MSLFDFHIHIQGDYTEIEKKLDKIYSSIKLIHTEMATKADFQALAQELRDAFLNISNDITRLTDQLAAGGMTEAEEAEVLEEFRTLATDAKALADRTPEPAEPPIEEPPTPEV